MGKRNEQKNEEMLGDEELTVKDMISYVEKGDEFGRKIVQAQIRMLKVLASNA